MDDHSIDNNPLGALSARAITAVDLRVPSSRLPALKPGEVEELAILREIVRMLDEARERNRRRPRGAGAPPMGDEIDDLLHRLYEIGAHPAMRAQPTPTEKEPT